MKINWKRLVICVAIPLAVGGLSALLTRDNMALYEALARPQLSPPGGSFPVVWSVLFVLMGVASYLVASSREPREAVRRALVVYGIQLALNFLWTLLFFNAGMYFFAFVLLVVLWVLIVVNTVLFWRIRSAAGWLMLPYLLWVTFAGYLNYGIFVLN